MPVSVPVAMRVVRVDDPFSGAGYMPAVEAMKCDVRR